MSTSRNFLLLLCLIGTCLYVRAEDLPNTQPRLIGGEIAYSGQFPYQVSLRNRNLAHLCGGAILTHHWIVTSAQCTQGQYSTPVAVLVAVGATTIGNDSRFYELQQIVNHPEFNSTRFLNDISMLRTAKTIKYEHQLIFSVALPSATTDYKIEHGIGITYAKISGWGAFQTPDDNEPIKLSSVLRYQEVSVLNRQSCKRHLGRVKGLLITCSNICTGNKFNQGICMGDIGSPLVVTKNNELIGIASWNIPCGRGYPDVYTRIFPFYNWIQQNLNSDNPILSIEN